MDEIIKALLLAKKEELPPITTEWLKEEENE